MSAKRWCNHGCCVFFGLTTVRSFKPVNVEASRSQHAVAEFFGVSLWSSHRFSTPTAVRGVLRSLLRLLALGFTPDASKLCLGVALLIRFN